MTWIPRSETNDAYCDWLIDRGYDPADQEEDDAAWQEYCRERRQERERKQRLPGNAT